MKKSICGIILLIIVLVILIVIPNIEFSKNGKLIKLSYSEDVSEFENNSCYDESYFYNKERDISVHEFDIKKILFFYVIVLEYSDGNVCETEYLLEKDYLDDFFENAVITSNVNNIDLFELIKGKKAIVSNKRYSSDNYEMSIEYILNGEEEILFVFYVDDLLVIQVGLGDEGPKFIAYE